MRSVATEAHRTAPMGNRGIVHLLVLTRHTERTQRNASLSLIQTKQSLGRTRIADMSESVMGRDYPRQFGMRWLTGGKTANLHVPRKPVFGQGQCGLCADRDGIKRRSSCSEECRMNLVRRTLSVSAGIKQQHFRRFCSRHQQPWVEGSELPTAHEQLWLGTFSC